MKLKSFVASLCFIVFLGVGGITVSAESNDEILKEANKAAEKHGLETTDTSKFKGERLEFDSVEEFETFLQEQDKLEQQEPQIQLFATSNPSYCERNLTGKICVEGTVKRNSSGMITGVSNVHSYQSGVIFGITWKELYTDYSYSTRSGSLWAVGEKTYGIAIEGIPAGYVKKHTITRNF
ncbi:MULTISPECIES: hypothetical protein [Clostridia]|uniref:hypothetical protein n=1 Tax=Clostridia TaxID=186801 RepID=UPI000EA3605A|nr:MULTISPECIES: hypothetical protein [Clostridia]NBJ68926.1 hypothetical protein [Roseburia sp. 1XD42-34]RKI79831.1 hypothetical protein D7V87_05470 [Clostridium sp. 1xD42-85]